MAKIIGIAILTWVVTLVGMSVVGWEAANEENTGASRLIFSILITIGVVLLSL